MTDQTILALAQLVTALGTLLAALGAMRQGKRNAVTQAVTAARVDVLHDSLGEAQTRTMDKLEDLKATAVAGHAETTAALVDIKAAALAP